MAKLSKDISGADPVLELLYDEGARDAARARALQQGLSNDAVRELEDFKRIKQAFDIMGAADEPSATTSQNILRQARLAAAERAAKPKRGFLALLMTPAAALAALLILAAIPTIYMMQSSGNEAVDRTGEESEIVATGVEPGAAAGGEMLAKGPSPPQAEAEDESESPAGKANNENETSDRIAMVDPTTPPSKSARNKGSQAGASSINAAPSGSGSGGSVAVVQEKTNDVLPEPTYNADRLSPDEVLPPQESVASAALTAYNNGDMKVSIEQFSTIIDTLSGDDRVQAHYYRGMAHARLEQHLEAVEDLVIVVKKHPGFEHYDQARYTYATSLVALGSPADAQSHLEKLAGGDSEFQQPASSALEELKEQVLPGGGGSSSAGSTARKPTSKGSSSKKKPANKIKQKQGANIKRSMEFDSDDALSIPVVD